MANLDVKYKISARLKETCSDSLPPRPPGIAFPHFTSTHHGIPAISFLQAYLCFFYLPASNHIAGAPDHTDTRPHSYYRRTSGFQRGSCAQSIVRRGAGAREFCQLLDRTCVLSRLRRKYECAECSFPKFARANRGSPRESTECESWWQYTVSCSDT